MSNDPETRDRLMAEGLVLVSEVAAMFDPPLDSDMIRRGGSWHKGGGGVNGVRLETIRKGIRNYTSISAVLRFVKAVRESQRKSRFVSPYLGYYAPKRIDETLESLRSSVFGPPSKN